MINKYAKIENNLVINVIECEDSVISEFFGTFIKVTELTGTPHIGEPYNFEKNKFINPKPMYDSWIFDEELLEWKAPIAKPEGNFFWDEENTRWIEIVIPEGEDRIKTKEELAAIYAANQNN